DRLGEAADHQRGREGPGLALVIAHILDADACFLKDLAGNRLLDGLARLDETGEAGIETRRKARAPAHQAFVAMQDHHDGNGVGAWKMRRLAVAVPADAGVSALLRAGRGAADGAEAMAIV